MTGHQTLIEAIDALLPQTQCGKCGHPGCRPYAEAIAAGEPINRCPPGGESTLAQLAELTGQPPLPLAQPAQPPLVAVIREAECIGCTKCIQACPVDAILGASKRMHTVIVQECTGCELCVAPCPVDCIDLLPHPAWQAADSDAARQAYLRQRAQLARQRFMARTARLEREAQQKQRERQRRAIQQRSRASRSAAPLGEQRQRQMAVKAAEQALKRARQQYDSARRRQDDEALHLAEAQLDQATHLLNEARDALLATQPR